MKIKLDCPNQPFCPGSSVSGRVLVDVNKPKSYKRIFIKFFGEACVEWTERRDGGGGPGSGVCVVPYTWSEVYVDVEQTLWTVNQSPDGHLAPGKYKFPFCFEIPPNVPTSFEGTVGSIRYTLHGRIATGPLKIDQRIKSTIRVQQVVNISDPHLLQPVCQEVQKTVCGLCSHSDPIVLTVTLSKTGYYVGETLPLHVTIRNGSSRCITLNASLCQSVQYTANGHHQYSKRTLVSIVSDKIAPQITRDWDPALQIPAADHEIMDEHSCSNIKISYSLTITVIIPLGRNLSTEIPLKLGYVDEQPPLGFPSQPDPQVLPPPYPYDRPPPYSQTAPAPYQAAPINQT